MPGCPIFFAFSVEASPMATRDDFPLDDPIPLFLSNHAEEPEQPGIGKAWDRAVISSRIRKASVLFTTGAIVAAVLLVGNPPTLFPNTTSSLVDTSAPQAGTTQSMPVIQSTADAQALPPTAREVPTGDEIAAAFKTAYQSQTTEALFTQFQAWAAKEDARAQVRPVQPVQDAQAQVEQSARAQVQSVQKHRHTRHARAEKNARAKLAKNARAHVRREQNARAQDRPVQSAQAQVGPEQNALATWPERWLGWLH